MIKNLKNIQTTFSLMRLICISLIIVTGIVCVSAVFLSFQYAEAQRSKIYVLDNGKSLILALAQDDASNRPAEARSHIKRFHELFFTFAPNLESIRYNTNQALALADESARLKYQELEQTNFYNNMIAASASQELRVDSINIDFNTYPYKADLYGTLSLVRSSSLMLKNLVTECYIRKVPRSDSNPHGFLIERLQVIESNILKEIKR